MSVLTSTINQRQVWAARHSKWVARRNAVKSMLEYAFMAVAGFYVYSNYETIVENLRVMLTR